jgi:hypothetical protein
MRKEAADRVVELDMLYRLVFDQLIWTFSLQCRYDTIVTMYETLRYLFHVELNADSAGYGDYSRFMELSTAGLHLANGSEARHQTKSPPTDFLCKVRVRRSPIAGADRKEVEAATSRERLNA